MNRICENHDERIARSVHPERSPCKSCVAEAADGKYFAARPRKRRVNVPPESTGSNTCGGLAILREDGCSSSGRCRLLWLGHQLQCCLLQGKIAWSTCEAVQQGLREQRNIACG